MAALYILCQREEDSPLLGSLAQGRIYRVRNVTDKNEEQYPYEKEIHVGVEQKKRLSDPPGQDLQAPGHRLKNGLA